MKDKRFPKGYSLVVREPDITSLLPSIAAAGFDGIEPTFVTGALPSPENHIEGARKLRSVCDGLGLAIPSMRGGRVPWTTIVSNDKNERARALDHTWRACEALAEMGGAVLLVVPGERTPGIDLETHWRRVVDYGRAAAEIATGFGMRIGLENVEARFPSSERDWLALIDEIGSDRLGIYLDVGNVLWMGFGYPEDWIRTLGKRIIQLHFKDATYRLNGATLHAEIRQILDGEVNWPEVIRALDEVLYKGWISVEPESYRYLPDRLPLRLAADLDALFKLGTGGT